MNKLRLLVGLLSVSFGVGLVSCGTPTQTPDSGTPCTPLDDGNDCTEDVCVSNVPENKNLAAGTTCGSSGGTVCDGTGACVGCLEDADCTSPKICKEATHVCVDPACDDDEKNGNETGQDCGGSCAPASKCADGLGCLVAGDCVSGVCGSNNLCAAPRCGDGVSQTGEVCDDGNATNGDGCDDGTGGNCRPSGCGNGVVAGTEVCDDGNATNGDGCDNNCKVTACGNGVVAGAEACDDNGVAGGDGCSATCTVEAGFTCSMSPSVCATTCGDGIKAGTEACDDTAPAENGDGCSATCTVETGYVCTGSAPSVCVTVCGDGVPGGTEVCDDGNMTNGDGCDDGTGGNCTASACGNAVIAGTEVCDDGNTTNGDGCDNNCTVTACGNGVTTATETCDDNGTADGDGCSSTCATETGYTCVGSPSVCTAICGDGVKAATEACDDAPPAEAGDGCSATCTIEMGFTCTGMPSVCTTTCGDGIRAGSEACDDGAVLPGDGCSPTCAVESGYTCTGSPSVCATVCGDGVRAGAEGCDDGNAIDGDGCSTTCVVECGNGVVGGTEQCDDNNVTNGDGCSSTCTFEVTCGTGETLVQVRSTDVPKAIPDSPATGVDSSVDVPSSSQGAVRKVVLGIGRITHTYDGDLDLYLVGPSGLVRELSTDNGGIGDNYVMTRFDDSATTAITAGTVPFTGIYRPEQTLSDLAGFNSKNAAGTWLLRAVDDGTGDIGTIDSWTLSLCVDPTAYCGNSTVNANEECDDGNTVDTDTCSNSCQIVDGCGDGNIDGSERCDDNNITSGDGCSATCQVEITCGTGETAVVVSNGTQVAILDAPGTGALSPVSVTATGAVTRAMVVVGSITHTNDADLDIFLVGPSGMARELSTDNGGANDNYVSTFFDDSATTLITAGTAPFSGRYRPEFSLSTTPGTDFRQLSATGTWNLRVTDDLATNTGTLDSWTLALCVDPTGPFCGDSIKNGTEECDDGNAIDTDACSNSCQLVDGCGDGNIDTGERCDDNNLASGDGCSATCQVEITCGTGETPVIVSNTTQVAIPDSPAAGVLSPVTVTTAGAVTRAVVVIGNIAHTADGDLDIFLVGPNGLARELSTDNGGTNDNYVSTFLDDSATAAITSGTAPYSGRYRPEFSLSTTVGTDFRQLAAAGTWNLRVTDDTTTNTGTLDQWTLALCVDPAAPYCGDSITNGTEECDDGNTVGTDACSNFCTIVDGCGDGNIDGTEECDDNNLTSGDGCSATCVSDISCGTGETAVIVRNTTATPVPDNVGGLLSAMNVPTSGLVRKVIATMSITHPTNTQLDVSLVSPYGVQRDLSSDQTGANYTATIFSDAAATAITGGTAPYTGAFRPEQTISNAAGFASQTAAGNWWLHVSDDTVSTTGSTGTLDRWTLALCVDTSAASVCGNGIVELAETCDDANTTSGDGCSATCQVELGCPTGSTAVVSSASNLGLIIQDNNPAGATHTFTVTAAGVVRKVVVVVGSVTHAYDSDVDLSLIGPNAATVDLSSDNGTSLDDYISTVFDDSAATAVTSGTAPFRGSFRPEAPLSALNGITAAGTWTFRAVDDANIDSGVFQSWTLGLCVE